MQSSLCITIHSPVKPDKEEITFYETDDWSIESEKQFLANIQKIFSIARKLSKSAHVSLSFETDEVKELFFLIQRKINAPVEINSIPKFNLKKL